MKKMIGISIGCLMMCLVQAADGLSANVYVWTDENGVKHYSNVAPPESAGDAVDQVDELSGEGQVSEQPSIQPQKIKPKPTPGVMGIRPRKIKTKPMKGSLRIRLRKMKPRPTPNRQTRVAHR